MTQQTFTLEELQDRARARKLELGIVDTPEYIDSLRNKGANRTPEKRELLRRIDERRSASQDPDSGDKKIISYY